jgi:hypothetical protein
MEMEQSLTTEHEVVLMLIYGRPELSQHAIADEFNNKHPDVPLPPSHFMILVHQFLTRTFPNK